MEYSFWDSNLGCYKSYDQLNMEDMLFNLSSFELYGLIDTINKVIRKKDLIEGTTMSEKFYVAKDTVDINFTKEEVMLLESMFNHAVENSTHTGIPIGDKTCKRIDSIRDKLTEAVSQVV